MQILLRAFLILLILTIAAALFIVLYKRMRPVRNAHFICPNCGAVTMPGKWARALAPARAAIACCNAPPAVNSATCPLFGTLNRPPSRHCLSGMAVDFYQIAEILPANKACPSVSFLL